MTLGNPSKNFTAKICSRKPRKPISLHYGLEKILPDWEWLLSLWSLCQIITTCENFEPNILHFKHPINPKAMLQPNERPHWSLWIGWSWYIEHLVNHWRWTHSLMPRRHASKKVGSFPNPLDEFKKPNTSFMFFLHNLKRDTHAFAKHKYFAQEILACKHVPYLG